MFTSESARKAGQKSKRGRDRNVETLREAITQRIDIDDMFEQMNELSVAQQIEFKIKLLTLILPRLQSIQANVGLTSLKDFDRMTHEEKLIALKSIA